MQRADAEKDDQSIADAAKNYNRLENVLLQNRTLTLFGEINQDVARRMAEKLLALAFESDDPITLYIGSPVVMSSLGIRFLTSYAISNPRCGSSARVGWAALLRTSTLLQTKPIVLRCRIHASLFIS